MSMETFLDPGRGVVQKGLLGGVDLRRWRLVRRTKTLRISLCPTELTTLITDVMIILQHPDHRDSPILFLGNLRGLKIRPTFGNELRHHCLHYGHGPDATSFIQDNSVPFLNAWNCQFQMMKSCTATKILSPQEQINLLRGSR